MTIAIVVIVVLIVSIIIAKSSRQSIKDDAQKQVENYQKELLSRNIISEHQLIHLGGHPYLQVNDKVTLQIKTNNTIHFQKENTNTGEEIPISNLTRYDVKTESQIQSDVTLTRLLALGIFAFGAKKKTKIEDQYLILSYVQNDIDIDCIFKRRFDYQQLGDIASTLNRVKVEINASK
ncbi:hypothetical protein SDC9_15166 [bioreactor metagenome]|uniref:Uncharacterized protein n=1 Tax=bioreactor metagenome TaxID=1076179 RepID=A0A644TR32_9ZZZZ|nr:hypothetical protein [Desulfitobacterium hafniense]MEA5023918.1 hypothetical protein [Desulfitobacterium hafniense]